VIELEGASGSWGIYGAPLGSTLRRFYRAAISGGMEDRDGGWD